VAGRPRGTQALTEVWKIRLSPAESATYERRRGTSTRSAYVRRALRAYAEQDKAPQPVPPQQVVFTAPDKTHRHRPVQQVEDRYEQGVLMRRHVCDCGHDMGWRRA
jgi:hypothetical protein